MGVKFGGFNIGKRRVSIALPTSGARTYTHAGCNVKHRTKDAMKKCRNGR